MDLDKAATKIQSTFRNYRARKSICLGDCNPSGENIQFEDIVNDHGKNVRDLVDEKFKSEENEPRTEGNF